MVLLRGLMCRTLRALRYLCTQAGLAAFGSPRTPTPCLVGGHGPPGPWTYCPLHLKQGRALHAQLCSVVVWRRGLAARHSPVVWRRGIGLWYGIVYGMVLGEWT